jgi:hypothetical protein
MYQNFPVPIPLSISSSYINTESLPHIRCATHIIRNNVVTISSHDNRYLLLFNELHCVMPDYRRCPVFSMYVTLASLLSRHHAFSSHLPPLSLAAVFSPLCPLLCCIYTSKAKIPDAIATKVHTEVFFLHICFLPVHSIAKSCIALSLPKHGLSAVEDY